jgi:cellulose synthase/poly-beta-1,6-N-acetylglucosamine synthase-like glycosyltransferase
MPVTLIATVLNEGESLRTLMDSIASQTRLPDEVIICDGGSTDNTLAILHGYAGQLPLRVIERPGANISAGRNAAVRVAAHDLIAVTDAGVRLDPEWLQRIVAPLEADPAVQVVSGFFQSDPLTAFEVALGATTLPEMRDINPAAFLPSSRSVAFRRSAFEAAGGYPEWLDFCEDLILDFRLKAKFDHFAFAPGAVAHFRPRHTLGAFFRQYVQYARGDGKANLFARRHLVRYLTYFLALPLVAILGVAVSPWWWLGLLAGAAYMLGLPYRHLSHQWADLTTGERLVAALWVPVIRAAGDAAKMIGYPAGVAWRWRNHPPDWRRG